MHLGRIQASRMPNEQSSRRASGNNHLLLRSRNNGRNRHAKTRSYTRSSANQDPSRRQDVLNDAHLLTRCLVLLLVVDRSDADRLRSSARVSDDIWIDFDLDLVACGDDFRRADG
jgi:hypothetical protein